MSEVRRRGLIIFIILVLVGIFGCFMMPFVWMPAAGIGMAMPVITVPGEVVTPGGFFGINLTNTLVGTLLADVMVAIFAILAYWASRGWTKEIPNRFQAFAEVIVEGFYGFMYNIGGTRLRKTPLLWPLVASIFLFLLAANLMKLFPGVETFGHMHCAEVDVNGYPITQGTWTDNSYILFVNSALNSGTNQTAATEEACDKFFVEHEFTRFTPAAGATMSSVINDLEVEQARLEAEIAAPPEGTDVATLQKELEVVEARITSAQQVDQLEEPVAALAAQVEALKAADAAEEPEAPAVTPTEAAPVEGADTAPVVAPPVVDLAALETDLATQQAALNLANTQLQYPGATVPLTQEELDRGVIPYIFHITPFVRGAATDLSLTIVLAIIAVISIQIYGVYAQGPAYFEKFINITALGNLSKKPMGVIDFLVGVFEIISEFSKIISLAFRLFGNLFAGGVALMAVSFLIALVVPGALVGLELIIGAVQALVFAVLTLVFTVQAMEGHHGDDEEHAAAEHH